MSRLEILKNSLIKKESEFDRKLQAHMDDVRSGNGQPMNDKRNGRSTMNRWDKQNDVLRNLKESIQKTKNAIENEEYKIRNVESVQLPTELKDLLDSGKITQWRKFPNRFFVLGVEKARLVWDEKLKKVLHQYVGSIPKGVGQFEIFKEVFNHLNNTLNKK